ncbi:hypothetical protein BC936DRAFT_149057 [Jimgerdemannia flammicorona]|uniref:Phosphodiesterase n=1 Tax=Jimgerdemannia flammicorona TaxID=994334 RepID=A0A433D1N7_9FUNG|nr:hypothetical protein BC936DRAFT_149057 [Jimgerdemannia flammicorona]
MLKFLQDPAAYAGHACNVFNWSKSELYGIVLGMFVKLDLHLAVGIQESELLDLVIDIDRGYLQNPYHSFYHAVDVTCVLYYMLTSLGAARHLTSLNMTILLIAALCHDIGHPGFNNVYQVNAKTDLAVRYKDTSVLEHYSCSLAMDLLTKHKFFRHLKRSCQANGESRTEEELRQSMVKMILATDMHFHYDLQDELGSLIESTTCSHWSDSESSDSDNHHHTEHEMPLNLPPTPTSPTSPGLPVVVLDDKQRQILCNILLHAADISNTVRPWPLCKRWSDLVVQEFWRQGDTEKREGLRISPGMDREDSNQPQISLKFGDFVVKPYFDAFADFLPNASVYLEALAANRIEWEAMRDKPGSHPPPPLLDEQHLPTNVVPENKPFKSLGRRVSVAAGLIIIPDHLDERLRRHVSPFPKRPSLMKRSFSSQRAASHHVLTIARAPDVCVDDDDDLEKAALRRRSEEPSAMIAQEKKTAPTEVSHRNLLHSRRMRMRRSSSLDPSITKVIKSLFRGDRGLKPNAVTASKSTDFPRQTAAPLGEAVAKLAEKSLSPGVSTHTAPKM